MSQNQIPPVLEPVHITEDQARKDIQSLNLINGFFLTAFLSMKKMPRLTEFKKYAIYSIKERESFGKV